MNKESFKKQIEDAKQQILDEKLRAERKAAEDKNRVEQEKKRKEIERQKEEEATKQDVIKKFAGTNIIETLEEIRDEKILIYYKHISYKRTEVKSFFGRRTGYFNKEEIAEVEPMKILFDKNTVIAEFDYWYDDGGENRQSESGCHCIRITKNNETFGLKYNYGNDFDVSSNNPSDIIGGVAKIIAARQLG